MDSYTASEEAYKRGYERGLEDGEAHGKVQWKDVYQKGVKDALRSQLEYTRSLITLLEQTVANTKETEKLIVDFLVNDGNVSYEKPIDASDFKSDRAKELYLKMQKHNQTK